MVCSTIRTSCAPANAQPRWMQSQLLPREDHSPVACVGGSFVIESVDCKGMLLMVVFKQSQIANGTNISPRIKNKRAESMGEDARQGTPAREGVTVEGKTILTKMWLMEIEKRMCFLVIENNMTRNDISASTFPEYPRCNSIPSCRVSLLRDVRFWASLHLLSKLAARGSMRQRY